MDLKGIGENLQPCEHSNSEVIERILLHNLVVASNYYVLSHFLQQTTNYNQEKAKIWDHLPSGKKIVEANPGLRLHLLNWKLLLLPDPHTVPPNLPGSGWWSRVLNFRWHLSIHTLHFRPFGGGGALSIFSIESSSSSRIHIPSLQTSLQVGGGQEW